MTDNIKPYLVREKLPTCPKCGKMIVPVYKNPEDGFHGVVDFSCCNIGWADMADYDLEILFETARLAFSRYGKTRNEDGEWV